MSIVLKTGFVSVTHNIKFQPQTVFKGKLLVLAGHVRDVEELRTKQGQSSIIHALIIRQTSITLPPYKTVLNVNTARVVTSVKCNCVYIDRYIHLMTELTLFLLLTTMSAAIDYVTPT
ncbi:hypothetical protein PYW08_015559 [Mythimna loreyi]|uniref:Uncharacterized protein n=1 Tax=Mythimna loreyi TaxID=667449 RepID=A0ACC2QWA7_9NEOP|nr:hypothetical protein PYW08_015559 [Mythimna loreyi]